MLCYLLTLVLGQGQPHFPTHSVKTRNDSIVFVFNRCCTQALKQILPFLARK